jgi:hypothetical protein
MHFEGEFRVPGRADDVIRRFADVPRMARCMPGAMLEPQAEDGSWPGAMVVSFGPKKINFKGRVTCEFDFAAKTGALHGRGAADMRAARIGVKVAFALRDDADQAAQTTIVRVTSDAELGGVLADFARTGGVAVANVLMRDFARRAADEFANDPSPKDVTAGANNEPEHAPTTPTATGPAQRAAPASDAHAASPMPATPKPAPRPLPAPATLSAHGVLWAVIKHKLRQLAAWLGLGTSDAT